MSLEYEVTGYEETPITVIRGSSTIIPLELLQDELPIDLTGASLVFTVKNKYDDSDDDAEFQIIETIHTDPVNGLSAIEIEPSDTENLNVKTFYYDLDYTPAGEDVITILRGKFIVVYDVRRGA